MFKLPLEVIGIGLAVGLVLAVRRICPSPHAKSRLDFRNLAANPIIVLALMCFGLAQWLGGSGFIAAFVGGLTFGALTKRHKEQFLSAAERSGDVVALVTWFTVGTVCLALLEEGFTWQVLVYALLSLTLVRMLPVLCLLGKGLQRDTLLFWGWFGPRGLASIVFLVMVVDAGLPGNKTIGSVVVWTIVLSIVLHGLTANPLASKYGARVDARGGAI